MIRRFVLPSPLGCAIWCLALAAAPLAAQESPEDAEEFAAGSKSVATKCIECHSLQRVFEAHYTRAGWEDAIDRMKEQGLEISGAERNDVIDYLLSTHHDHTTWESIGQLHFMFVHFPIALVFAAVFLEILLMLRRQQPTADAVHWVVRLAALSAIPTVLLGLCLVADKATYPPGVALHRNLGLLSGALILTAWFLRERSVRRGTVRGRLAYRSFLVLSMVFVGFTGHLGGVLVHGDYVAQWMHAFQDENEAPTAADK